MLVDMLCQHISWIDIAGDTVQEETREQRSTKAVSKKTAEYNRGLDW